MTMQPSRRSPADPTRPPPFLPRFLLFASLLCVAAGLFADPGFLARLFSSHAQFSDDIVQAVQTLRVLLAGGGGLVFLTGGFLYRVRFPWYRALNNAALNTMLFLGTLAVVLLMAEAVFRWLDPWGVSQFREARRYFSQAVIPGAEPDLGYLHKPSFEGTLVGAPVKINARGLRDRELPYEKPGSVFRILCLGDSVTFGWGVQGETTFARGLEALLNRDRAPEKFQVINAGVGGYNTVQEAAFYRTEARKYASDLVLLFFTVNDAAPALTPLQGTPANPEDRFRNLGRVSLETFKRIFATLVGFVRYMALPKTDVLADYRAGSDGNWERCTDAIRSLSALAREDGSAFAVVLVPAMQDLKGEYPFGRIHERMAAFCKAEGIPLFDLLPDFRGLENMEVRISIFDGHPNRSAHARIARAVETRLEASDLLPPPRPPDPAGQERPPGPP
jgi:lysophospholipase L1-like esterase